MRKSIFLSFILVFLSSSLYAAEYEMNPEQSSIQASIRYTVLGRYKAQFKEYDSAFYFDQEDIGNSFVEMVFHTALIDSGLARFDRIVRSERLLDAAQYPEITFRSHKIEKRDDDYWVRGELDLHGVKRELKFTFQLEEQNDGTIYAAGTWRINRKDFDIRWHPVFDVGGILVGNTITIDWEILAEEAW